MNTVLRFQSSALRPGANIAPINAKEPTVVAALRNFISLSTSFDPNRSLLFAQVQREADLGGMFRISREGTSRPISLGSYVSAVCTFRNRQSNRHWKTNDHMRSPTANASCGAKR